MATPFRSAVDLLKQYAEYHRDQRNILTHFLGVPMIVFAMGVLLARPTVMLGGLALKQAHPRPWVWPRQLGTAASMLTILMFVLVSSMAVQGDWGGAITWAGLALILARAAAKVASLLATSAGSGMSLRQTLWVGAAMVPMSSVALLIVRDGNKLFVPVRVG